MCLIADGIGRDSISDFVTNLILDYLCQYTAEFAAKHMKPSQARKVIIDRGEFDYDTQTWKRKSYELPWYDGDYVILTPKDILTRDENWINRSDMIGEFEQIPAAIPDAQLRAAVSNYFHRALERRAKPKKPPTAKDRHAAAAKTIGEFPQLVDYYIKLKEMNGDEAVDISSEKVFQTEVFFSQRMREILKPQLEQAGFYDIAGGTYAEAHTRLAYLKHAIEDQGCWRIFYDKNNQPFEREKDIQILFRLVWFGTPYDMGTEANDGRGPVDFKVSKGRNKTLVEMKLAKNSKLEANLAKQVEVYQSASDAEKGIKAIIFFSEDQLSRVETILRRLGLLDSPDVILIDARSDNKPSASNA